MLTGTWVPGTQIYYPNPGSKVPEIIPKPTRSLVRARSSWLGLGTEPPADRSPNRIHIVRMRCSTHGPLSSAVKPGLLGGERSLTDMQTCGGDARSPNGDVDRNSISIVS